MSIETRPCVMCGYTLLIIDSETQPCINCNTEREFKRDSIDYVGCRECGKEIVVDKSDPINTHLCDNCNGEY